MKTSRRGIDLIKQFEGLRLDAYVCAAGVLTIGYGHTGPDVQPGMTITEEEADALLRADLEKFERCVSEALTVDVIQPQFDALVSFAFNVGCQALLDSTLLKLINVEDFEGAAAQFARWNKAGGRELAGLTRRRAAEAELFLA